MSLEEIFGYVVMFLLAYFALAIIIKIFKGIYKMSTRKSKTSSAKSHTNKSPKLTNKQHNIIRCNINGRYDEDGTIGRYKNGVVYCVSKYSNFVAGYYCEEEKNVLTVRAASDKEVIGYVTENKIILSRKGQLDRFEKMGYPKSTTQRDWYCAERFSNCICDLKNTDCVALCEEDNWEAAAAFICMQHENCFDNEFHNFWYGWL